MLAAIALTTDRSMHPGRSQAKAAEQGSRSLPKRTRPQFGGASRMCKTAWLGRPHYRSPDPKV